MIDTFSVSIMQTTTQADYGDRRGPQGRLHYPAFERGCYYGPHPDRDGPCWLCWLRTLA